jgi:predicted RND superfamily exporter protein
LKAERKRRALVKKKGQKEDKSKVVMKQKEYPMDEDYNRALAFLTEQIAERDEMVKQLKFLPPEARPEALRLLDELNKAIERGEQALANEYEAFQNQRRLEEEEEVLLDEVMERMSGAYVHVKYRNPEMLPQMEAIINNMPPEESKAFYERAAQHEAGDLVRIIRREGETREEAEEFLKNYRAAKGE